MKLFFALLTIITLGACSSHEKKVVNQSSVISSSRAPAAFVDEIELIHKAITMKYGEAATDFEYRASHNPLVYIGNGAMRIGKLITKIPSERVREYEIMHRIYFKINQKEMDCYGGVREIRSQPGVYFVSVGTCNQNFSDLLNWKEEFSTYLSTQE